MIGVGIFTTSLTIHFDHLPITLLESETKYPPSVMQEMQTHASFQRYTAPRHVFMFVIMEL